MDNATPAGDPSRPQALRLAGLAFGVHLPVALAYALFCEGPFYHLYLFAVAIVFTTWVPGLLVLDLLRVSLNGLSRLVVSLASGIVFLATLFYLLRGLAFDAAFYPILIFLNGVCWVRYRHRLRTLRWRMPSLTPARGALCAMLVLVLAMTVLINYPSGHTYDDGLRFYGTHSMDSVWHIARVAELSHTVPPRNPLQGDTPLKYHLLSHSYLGALERITGISILDLFFRLVPTMVLPLLALAIYVVVRSLTEKPGAAVLSVLCMFTAGDFAYAYLIRKISDRPLFEIASRGDIYYEMQAFMGNHFNYLLSSFTTLFGFLLLFAALRLFIARLQEPSGRIGSLIACALLFGALVQTKVQLAALAAAALCVSGVVTWWQTRDLRPIGVALCSLVVMVLFAVPIITARTDGMMKTGFAASGAIPRPQSGGEHLIHSALLLPGLNLWEPFPLGSAESVWVGVPLGVLCLLGIRVVGIPAAIRGLRSCHAIRPVHLFFVAAMVCGLVAPFFRLAEPALLSHFLVGVAFINIYFAMALNRWLTARRRAVGSVVVGLCLLAALPMWVFKMGSEWPSNNLYARVSDAETEYFSALHAMSTPDARIIRPVQSTFPLYRDAQPVAETSGDQFLMAFARRRVLILEDKAYPRVALETLDPVAQQVHHFFADADPAQAQAILHRLRVSHVVVPNALGRLPFESAGILKAIYSNAYGTLYTVVPDAALSLAHDKDSTPWTR